MNAVFHILKHIIKFLEVTKLIKYPEVTKRREVLATPCLATTTAEYDHGDVISGQTRHFGLCMNTPVLISNCTECSTTLHKIPRRGQVAKSNIFPVTTAAENNHRECIPEEREISGIA